MSPGSRDISNIVSVFLEEVLKLKKRFKERVRVDIPQLVNPRYLQADIITKDFLKYIVDSITFMYQNQDISYWEPLAGTGFWEHEISKLIRIYNLVGEKPENRGCIVARKDFATFIDEHDRRYGTNFVEVFPEYTDFYYHCKEL